MRKWEILIYYWRGILGLATHRMVVESEKYPEASVQEFAAGGFTFATAAAPSRPRGTHVFVPRRAIFRIETSEIDPREEEEDADGEE